MPLRTIGFGRALGGEVTSRGAQNAFFSGMEVINSFLKIFTIIIESLNLFVLLAEVHMPFSLVGRLTVRSYDT